MKVRRLSSIRIKNFKAIRDSGTIKLTPLTVFIGNNGSGKSSVIEALETFQAIVEDGLDKAMQRWHGLEYVWNRMVTHELQVDEFPYHTNPMHWDIRGSLKSGPFVAKMEVNVGAKGALFIHREGGEVKGELRVERGHPGPVKTWTDGYAEIAMPPGVSSLGQGSLGRFIHGWQFLSLVPQLMGNPAPQLRAQSNSRLDNIGSHLAQYLHRIRETDQTAFDGIVEAIRSILPYARDVRPTLTSELERMVYLQLREGDSWLPGWLLSTGTLRLLALLAVLRNPSPPPVIFVEEIENGLDPRTIHLIVEEIRNAVESGRTQVIATTHSPYLLDLLSLSHIVVVERVAGEPKFSRPANQSSLKQWAEKFSPGKLYTMERLSRAGGE